MDRRSRLVVSVSIIALATLALGSWAANAHTQTYKTNLTIHYDKKTDSFEGHLGTSSFCQEGRAIHVFQVSSAGSDIMVGSTTSEHAGHWSGIASPGAGTYYATTDERQDSGYGHDHRCLADTSGTVAVS
jgi:hypothetical protein